MPLHTTTRLTPAYASVLTTEGLFQTTALVLPYTGLGLTPTSLMRRCVRAQDERWTITHLSTGRAVCPVAEDLSYDTARRLMRTLVALPIDWRAESPMGDPEALEEAKQVLRESRREPQG